MLELQCIFMKWMICVWCGVTMCDVTRDASVGVANEQARLKDSGEVDIVGKMAFSACDTLLAATTLKASV